MYNSDLEELIAFYIEEKQNLEKLIKECVEEMDYQLAEYHFQALGYVNRQLQTFENLLDPTADEKYYLKSRLALFEKQLKEEFNDFIKEVYTERVKETKAKIEALTNCKSQPEIVGTEFENLLYDLAEGIIKGFRLNLIKEQNLYLEFSKNEEQSLLISFTAFNKLPENIFDDEEQHVYALGFYKNKEANCLQYKYDFKQQNAVRFISKLVSRTIFEVFYFKEFDNPATIEIFTERTSE